MYDIPILFNTTGIARNNRIRLNIGSGGAETVSWMLPNPCHICIAAFCSRLSAAGVLSIGPCLPTQPNGGGNSLSNVRPPCFVAHRRNTQMYKSRSRFFPFAGLPWRATKWCFVLFSRCASLRKNIITMQIGLSTTLPRVWFGIVLFTPSRRLWKTKRSYNQTARAKWFHYIRKHFNIQSVLLNAS